MFALALAGALLSFTIYIFDNFNVSGICPTSGCAKVASSEYSYFLFIPVSLWGLIYYLSLGVVIILRIKGVLTKYVLMLLPALLGLGLIFTLYLRYLEIFKIGAICFWCWISVIIVLLLIILYIFYAKRERENKKRN